MFGADGANADAKLIAEKELIKKIIGKYNIARSATLFGAVIYDTDANLAIRFGDVYSKENAKNAIGRLQRRRAGNNLVRGLEVARDRLFDEKNGARRNVPKTLIVFVDKKSSNEEIVKMATVAKQLQDSGVKLIVIGIGSKVDKKQLSAVASDSTTLFKPPTLESLENVLSKVAEASRPGKFKLLLHNNLRITCRFAKKKGNLLKTSMGSNCSLYLSLGFPN